MRSEKNINIGKLLYFGNIIIGLAFFMFDLENAVSCYETYYYQVYVCNISFTHIGWHISLFIFSIWTIWLIYRKGKNWLK